MAKILVSFKEKENDLFEIVNSQGDKSNFMKDALKFYLKHRNENIPVQKSGIKKNEIKDEIIDILEDLET